VLLQAEDGIRDDLVTGVQTCALPICARASTRGPAGPGRARPAAGGSSRRDVAALDLIDEDRQVVEAVRDVGHALVVVARGDLLEIGRASCRERWWTAGADGASETTHR